MIDVDGEWRETAGGKARELIAPSSNWLDRAADDPDAERVYAEVQAAIEAEAAVVTEDPPAEGESTPTEGT